MAHPSFVYFSIFIIVADAYLFEKYYPGTKVERMFVPKDLRPWGKMFLGYSTEYYSEPCQNVSVCDPPIETVGFEPAFNERDGKVDRRRPPKVLFKWKKEYTLMDGYPLNPKGRTGLAGRGSLPRWGPNHLVCVLMKRGSTTPEYAIMVTGNNTEYPDFPHFFVDDPKREAFPTPLLEALKEKLGKKYNPVHVQEMIANTLSTTDRFWHGYLPDQRNTDNAWIELTIYEFIDADYEFFGLANFKVGNNPLNLEWKKYDVHILNEQLERILARSKKTFWNRVPRSIQRMHLMKKQNKISYVYFVLRVVLAILGISLGIASLALG